MNGDRPTWNSFYVMTMLRKLLLKDDSQDYLLSKQEAHTSKGRWGVSLLSTVDPLTIMRTLKTYKDNHEDYSPLHLLFKQRHHNWIWDIYSLEIMTTAKAWIKLEEAKKKAPNNDNS